MINTCTDFGGLPVCFIRYNPDGYKNNLGEKITSTKGRENRLINCINSCLLHPPMEILTCIYLYYDGDNGENKIVNIDIDESVKKLVGK